MDAYTKHELLAFKRRLKGELQPCARMRIEAVLKKHWKDPVKKTEQHIRIAKPEIVSTAKLLYLESDLFYVNGFHAGPDGYLMDGEYAW